jgi:hypothetical protein
MTRWAQFWAAKQRLLGNTRNYRYVSVLWGMCKYGRLNSMLELKLRHCLNSMLYTYCDSMMGLQVVGMVLRDSEGAPENKYSMPAPMVRVCVCVCV